MEVTVRLKTTSVTGDIIDWPLLNKIIGGAIGKLRLILTYIRASMTNRKSGQIVWSSFDEERSIFCVI